MKKNVERKGRKFYVRVTAVLLAAIMVLITIPSDVTASITEVSNYQEMEEEITEIIEEYEEDSTEEVKEEVKEEPKETIKEEESDTLSVTEVTTEVTNEEFDIIITDKTDGALSVVSDILVEDKTTEVSETILEEIAELENLDIDDMVSKTLNIELKDENQDETQPEGTVTVTIAIPKEMNEEDFALYYIGDGEETPTKVDGTIEDGYFTFERSHFCQFCLVSSGSGVRVGQDIKYNEAEVLQNVNIGWYVMAKDTDNNIGAQSTVYYISTGADLRGLALLTKGNVYYKNGDVDDFGDVTDSSDTTAETAIQTNFSGKTIILTNDIIMNPDESFLGIGSKEFPFMGTFDGNGYCIKDIAIGDVYAKNPDGTYERDAGGNRKIVDQQVLTQEKTDDTVTASYIGLFNYVNKATIKNLGIENAQVVVSPENNNNKGHEPIYAAVLVAKDLGTSASSDALTTLSNVYIYNSKVSIRESTHRQLYEAGFVAAGAHTAIENSYTMKLSLTGTKSGTISSQTVKQASIAILSGAYENLSKVYYMETIYGMDTEANSYRGKATPVEEDLFTSITNEGVVALLNAGETNFAYELAGEHPTHPTFTRDANITKKTSAKVTISAVHNGSISSAGGNIRIKENINADWSDYFTTKTVRISKGYASFDSDNNPRTDEYLLLHAYKKDNGYNFEGWYTGMEKRTTYSYKTIEKIVLETPYVDPNTGEMFSFKKVTKTIDVTLRENERGESVEDASVEKEKENLALRKTEYTNDDFTDGRVNDSETTHKTANYYGIEKVSGDIEYYVDDNNFEDRTLYAVFSGSPYTVSTLLADIDCPYEANDTDEDKATLVGTLRGLINTGDTTRAVLKYKDDPYSEEQVQVFGDDGVTPKLDINGNPVYKTVTKGNILTGAGAIKTENYVTTYDLKKNGQITLYCEPNPGFAFIGWYASDNNDPFLHDTDELISDSKKNNCEVTIDNVKTNRIIKCVVTEAVRVYTFFTNAPEDTTFNGRMTKWEVNLADLASEAGKVEYNIYSEYGVVSIKENGTYPETIEEAKTPSYIGKGGTYTLSAKSNQGNRFIGWFDTPDPEIVDGAYTGLVSSENEVTLSMDSLPDEGYKVYYARFDKQAECLVEKAENSNVVKLLDEGITTRRVTYQYSGTGEAGYAYPNWASYVSNGLGKKPNGEMKADYDEGKDGYAWNGSLGYHEYVLDTKKLTGIDGKEIVLPYVGHYTFCFWPADGSVMYTKNIIIKEEDLDVDRRPSIDPANVSQEDRNLTAQFKVNARGHKINNVFYQLTWTPVSDDDTSLTDSQKDAKLAQKPYCDPLFSTWYRYVKAGQEPAVVGFNGVNGYFELGPDCHNEIVSLSEVGWYTFYIKYDDNKSDVYYIKVTSGLINGTATTTPTSREDLEDSNANGSIRVISKFSKLNVGIAVVQGYYENIAGASNQVTNSYGFRFTAEGETPIDVWQKGNRNAKTYIVNPENLVAGKDYTVEAIYKNSSGATVLVDQEAVPPVTMKAITPTVNPQGRYGQDTAYYATRADGTSYGFKTSYSGNIQIDTHGAYSLLNANQSGTILTTYSSAGWVVQSSDNTNIKTIPTARIVEGDSSYQYVLFTYVLQNNSANTISNYRIGFSADTMIYQNDYAPVSKEEFGFRICDSNDPTNENAINFVLIANSECNTDGVGQYTDTCSTKWFGHYSQAQGNAFNEIPDGSTYGGDSGAAFSYQNMTFAPGEVKTISFILGVAPTNALGAVDPNVPKPYLDKNGSLGTVHSNSTDDIEFRINKIIYQYTTSDSSSTREIPYDFTQFVGEGATIKGSVPEKEVIGGVERAIDLTGTRTNSGIKLEYGENAYDLSEFVQKGLENKALNTGAGYKTLFEESGYNYQYAASGVDHEAQSANMYSNLQTRKSTFYEENTVVNGVEKQQNNRMEFEEVGWYTFLIDYYEVYKGNIDGVDVYRAERYLKEINVYISSADLNGTPYIIKLGNMIQIYNHGSNLYSVTYQLTNTDENLTECNPLYTTWSEFWHTGQGLVRGPIDPFTHNSSWQQKSDYRVYTKVNSTNGYKTISKDLDIDGPQGARQLVFTTPGWYTFRLNYRAANGTQRSTVKYALITADDILNGGPRLDVHGNKITLVENDSNVTKVVYQLTSNDKMYMETVEGVSVDDYPKTVDTDLNKNNKPRNYIKWETLPDYPVDGTDEEKLAYKYWLDGATNEEEFLYMYEYGEGFYYTHVGDLLYKKAASTSDWTVFTKIGRANLSDYEKEKESDYLLKVNYTTGYRTMKSEKVHDDIKNRDYQVYDGSSVEVQMPGWYTFLITYGDGVTVAKYIQITEDAINNAPVATIDQETGMINVDTSNYDVLNAYISYATNTHLEDEAYPDNEEGLNYYLDSTGRYYWTGFYKYGTKKFTEQNGDEGYRTMLSNKRDEDSDFVENLRYVVNWAGWYNVYITYVVDDDKKVIVRHVKLENDVSGPVVKQITSDKVIVAKDKKTYNDNRMAIVYEDKVNNEVYPITKYAIGYFANNEGTYTIDEAGKYIPKNISTWYRMALATNDVRSVKDDKINVTSIKEGEEVKGRTFSFPVDREGYYVVMVIDQYYGLRVYITEVKDVPILDDTIEYAPKLYVNSKNITGVASNYGGKTGAEVAYLKDITDIDLTQTDINYTGAPINKEVFTKGNVLKIKTVGTKIIRTVAEDGRVYDLKAVVDSASTDATDLEKLIEKARKYLNTYHHYELTEDGLEDTAKPMDYDTYADYCDDSIPGAWAEYVHWEALNDAIKAAVDLINYDSKIDKDTFTAPDQTAIDAQYKVLYDALYKEDAENKEDNGFIKWCVVNEEEFIKVDGDTITVLAGDLYNKGRNVEYVIYSAKDVYDVSTEIMKDFAYRPIISTVWDSWAGISSTSIRDYWEKVNELNSTDYKFDGESGEYNKFNTPKENIVINDVPDGVYSFQIKVDGVVYYRNPVVHKDEDDSLEVVKTYLDELIAEANEMLDTSYTKEEYDGDNTKRPFVNATWKKILKNEIQEAIIYYDNAGVGRYNKGTNYKPAYINCDENGVIAEAATLHNVMRKYAAALSWGNLVHTIHMIKNGGEASPDPDNNFNEITSANGVIEVVNNYSDLYAKATKIIVSKGDFSSWSQMSQAGTTNYIWTAAGANKEKSTITVRSNGTYTIYVKYEDNVFEFYHFTVEGYNYPITAEYDAVTGKINISVSPGTKVGELQLADGSYTAYTKVTAKVNGFDTEVGTDQAFRDIWYKYPANIEPVAANRSKRTGLLYAAKIGDSGYTSETIDIAQDRLSISDHTLYAKLLNNDTGEYEEFFIPVTVNVNPMIVTDYRGEDTTVTALTSIGNVSWVAYAKGDHYDPMPGAKNWDGMVNADGGVKYIAQNTPVKIQGLDDPNDVYTFYFKGAKNGEVQNNNFIVVIGKDGGTIRYHEGKEDNSYHVGAKTQDSTNDVFVVSATSEKGLTMSKRFDASSDGTKIKYYKINAEITDPEGRPHTEVSSGLMEAPTNGQIIPLPYGLLTNAGDTISYTITFYSDNVDDDDHKVGDSLTGSYVISNEAIDDVYAVKSADFSHEDGRENSVVIYKVNEKTDTGKVIAYYTMDVKDVNSSDYVNVDTKKALSALTGGKIVIPSNKITNCIYGVDYRISLYDSNEEEAEAVQVITGTYRMTVNAKYKVVKSGLTGNDRTVTLTTALTTQPANGGKTAAKYALFYAKADGTEVAEVLDEDQVTPVTGTMATTITFKNLECYDKLLVKFYDESDIEFTQAVCTISDAVDEKWSITGSREDSHSPIKVLLTRTSQNRTGGKVVTSYHIVDNINSDTIIADNEAIENYTAPITFTSNLSTSAVDVYMYAGSELLYKFVNVEIKIPDPVDEVYEIKEINKDKIVVKKKSNALHNGKTVESADVVVKDGDIADDDPGSTIDLLTGEVDISSITTGTPGTKYNYRIRFYDSENAKLQELTGEIYIPVDESYEFISAEDAVIKFKRTIAEHGGKQAAKYTMIFTDTSNPENTVKVKDNSTVPGGINITITGKPQLELNAKKWNWTTGDHTVKVEVEFYTEDGSLLQSLKNSGSDITFVYSYTAPEEETP